MRAGDRRAPSDSIALLEYMNWKRETFLGPQKCAQEESYKNGTVAGSSLDFAWQTEHILIRLNLLQSDRDQVLLALLRFVALGSRLERAT